jgi:FkbM family methyltransferase
MSARQVAIEILSRGCAGLVRALPRRLQVECRERSAVVAPLDYPRGGIALHVDSVVELSRIHACRKEPETVAWIEAHVRPGDVFYDIGANVGAYSLVADRVSGGRARVYAFEPGVFTFVQLSRNVHLNQAQGRVVPLHVALSDRSGLSTFSYSSVAPGAALHAVGPGSPDRFEQAIIAYRLDDALPALGLPQPTAIKLDVDGHEAPILRGAAGVLRDPRLRTVLIEVEPGEVSGGEAVRLLEGAGFTLASQHPHGPAGPVNCIFTRAASMPVARDA